MGELHPHNASLGLCGARGRLWRRLSRREKVSSDSLGCLGAAQLASQGTVKCNVKHFALSYLLLLVWDECPQRLVRGEGRRSFRRSTIWKFWGGGKRRRWELKTIYLKSNSFEKFRWASFSDCWGGSCCLCCPAVEGDWTAGRPLPLMTFRHTLETFSPDYVVRIYDFKLESINFRLLKKIK